LICSCYLCLGLIPLPSPKGGRTWPSQLPSCQCALSSCGE